MTISELELLYFSVGENNEAILTILTDAGCEVLEIPEADIKAMVSMQASPPPLLQPVVNIAGWFWNMGIALI